MPFVSNAYGAAFSAGVLKGYGAGFGLAKIASIGTEIVE